MKKAGIVVVFLIILGVALYYWVFPEVYLTYFKKPDFRGEKPGDTIQDKINRSQAELRTLHVALDAWKLDNNSYPDNLYVLSTPIAYLTRVPKDPFQPSSEMNYKKISDTDFLVWGVGPDGQNDDGQISYDPNNGLNSSGDIVRSSASK